MSINNLREGEGGHVYNKIDLWGGIRAGGISIKISVHYPSVETNYGRVIRREGVHLWPA